MRARQEDVLHSLDQQARNFKQLDTNVKFNHQALVNMCSTIWNFDKGTQATFQEIAAKLDLGTKLGEMVSD
jgi:hypothetical protein